jgi:transcriptional regulator with XRE-family HTH domain
MAVEECRLWAILDPLSYEMSGHEFRAIRRYLGCTQTELAILLGLHHATISAYESSRLRIPQSLAILMRLLKNRLF